MEANTKLNKIKQIFAEVQHNAQQLHREFLMQKYIGYLTTKPSTAKQV